MGRHRWCTRSGRLSSAAGRRRGSVPEHDLPMSSFSVPVGLACNTTVMAAKVNVFLCPSDGGIAPLDGSGPVNYASVPGRGAVEGTRQGPTGHSSSDPHCRRQACSTDPFNRGGTEQRLGIAGPYSQTTLEPIPAKPSRAMARVPAGPLTDAACAEAPSGWLLNKGARWWDGNYLNTLYNHHEPRTPCNTTASPITIPAGRPRSCPSGRRQRALLRRTRRLREGFDRSCQLAVDLHEGGR